MGELPNEDNVSARVKDDASLPTPTTPYQKTLRAAARIIYNFHALADRMAALAYVIHHDMTSPTQTQVQGTFTIAGKAVSYKADFGKFDINGDGTPDGSGNAVDVPIAVRVWADSGNGYQRLMCALITTKPSADNFGAGQLYAKPSAARSDAPGNVQFYVNWDRTDPSHKWNEAFVTGDMATGLTVQNGHHRVDVRTEASSNSIEKTVRSADNLATNPYGLQTYQSSVHFEPGSGYALLSGLASGTGGSFSFTNVCADLVNQAVATNGECNAFDTQDMPFINAPTGTEMNFPADFPATPTFSGTPGNGG